MAIEVFCKKQPGGEFLRLPEEWVGKVRNYRGREGMGFITLDDCYKHNLNIWFPAWMQIWIVEEWVPRAPASLQEMCDSIFNEIIPPTETNFWLLYYYGYQNTCVLAAEENYFEGSEYEVIEVNNE